MAKHFQTPVTINNILYAQSKHNMCDRWMNTCYFLYMDFALTHLMKVYSICVHTLWWDDSDELT